MCVETTIRAPEEAVWAAIEDLSTHTRWMADAARIRVLSERDRGVGTVLACETVVAGVRTTDRLVVTAWEEGHLIEVAHRGLVRGWGRFLVLPAGADVTTFRWEEHLALPPHLGGRLAELVARPVLTRIWRADVERLRNLVEAGQDVRGLGGSREVSEASRGDPTGHGESDGSGRTHARGGNSESTPPAGDPPRPDPAGEDPGTTGPGPAPAPSSPTGSAETAGAS